MRAAHGGKYLASSVIRFMPTLPLPESQARLLDALALPIRVADADGRTLYETPALLQCSANKTIRERAELERELSSAACRLRARTQTRDPDGRRPVVLNLQVLTQRAEFRLRGVVLPCTVLRDGPGVLLALERLGKRGIQADDLCRRFGLTAREAEVARLLAKGLSDHDIAARLGISLRTAEHHTEHVLHKLGADRRSAVAALLAGG
jgi:DNA-binding CsgD family transcriptional regulator